MTPSPAGALSLKRFFGAMRPFLSGERDVGWVEETIGRYPSGTARLERQTIRIQHAWLGAGQPCWPARTKARSSNEQKTPAFTVKKA